MEEDPTTQELRIRQTKRAEEEREHAGEAPTEEATDQHEARADKAEYLRQKLAERAEAERRKG
ncbi:MAG TPA: hypothetical protein VH256_01715 [Thermoleophilaceae bacterium]|jgi:hypothetical protein|nr:hypothetical protein [Thermoleophilaceae bacterium]